MSTTGADKREGASPALPIDDDEARDWRTRFVAGGHGGNKGAPEHASYLAFDVVRAPE